MMAIHDQSQRQAAIDPNRSCIVQAPAGSGKTELLVQRYLGLLAVADRPREILAITFTRKAAAEMRRRVIGALTLSQGDRPQEAYAVTTWKLGRSVLERDRRLGWRLLENPAQLQILTIDSFNANLARQLPWSSGLGGMPRIDDDPTPLYRKTVRRVLLRLSSEQQELAATLLRHLDNRFDRLALSLESLLANRDQWLPLLLRHNAEERRALLEGTLADYVCAELARLEGLIPQDLAGQMFHLAHYAHENLPGTGWRGLAELARLGRLPRSTPDERDAWLGLAGLFLTEQGGWRKRPDKRNGFPAGGGDAAACKELLLQVIERLDGVAGLREQLASVRNLPPLRYDDGQWSVLESLIELLPMVVAELWEVFDASGAVDFLEVGLRALTALGRIDDPSELLLRLDASIRHILIDEFQDTSRLQWLLLEHLTSGWEAGDGRTLYLVGDPMQSIYRFREAEVGLFLRARSEGLGGINLVPLQLRCNFRSRPGLIDWFNNAFPTVFPAIEDEGLGAVPYAAAEAIRPANEGSAIALHPLYGRDDRAEAEQVVELVRQALANKTGSVAVLVRARSHLAKILAALRSAGIRYQGRDLDPLADRPAARDLIALTRALLHPADRLHWLAVLRAPWAGLTLTDLHVIAEGDADAARTIPERLADSELLHQLSADGRSRLLRIREILLHAVVERGRLGLRELVEGTWLALGGPAAVDAAGSDDIDRIFALLDELDQGGDLLAWQQLQDRLGQLFSVPDPLADGRLQVMTIHKAKGLEFDTVILPGLGRKPLRSDSKLLRWLEHPSHGLFLAPSPPAAWGERNPLYDAIGRMDQQKSDYETMRLLYVAVTRARENLHLVGHARMGRDGTPQPEAGSLLSILWSNCREHFSGAMQPDAMEGRDLAAVAEQLRRLPLDWQLPELSVAALPLPVAVARPSRQPSLVLSSKDLSDPDADVGRIIGIVLHSWLERLADGKEGTGERLGQQIETAIRGSLLAFGLPERLARRAVDTVLLGLKTTLSSRRGQWILSPHYQAACEWPLSGMIDGILVHAVIDRTFVEGTIRWVVDYKSGSPGNLATAHFLAAELERYRDQLEQYRALCRLFDPAHEVRAALYFPAFDGWIEA